MLESLPEHYLINRVGIPASSEYRFDDFVAAKQSRLYHLVCKHLLDSVAYFVLDYFRLLCYILDRIGAKSFISEKLVCLNFVTAHGLNFAECCSVFRVCGI